MVLASLRASIPRLFPSKSAFHGIPNAKLHVTHIANYNKLSIPSGSGGVKIGNKLKENSNKNRELILQILKLTTTRRETNSYLNKYSIFDGSGGTNTVSRLLFFKIKGNLLEYPSEDLVKFTKTLSHVKKLGGQPVLILDPDHLLQNTSAPFKAFNNYLYEQFNYLSSLNASHDEFKLIPLPTVLTHDFEQKLNVEIPHDIFVHQKNIPVLFPILYDFVSSKHFIVNSTDFITNVLSQIDNSPDSYTIEKVVFIDKFGGVPSIERSNNSNVLINLRHEYEEILGELQIGHIPFPERQIHIDNLNNFQTILNCVKSPENINMTGIITTLSIATEPIGTNPIIFNMLTDRSLISSSLPTGKINDQIARRISKTSIVKNGVSIHEITKVSDLDLTKFKALIDDSFKRPLDLQHYLDRISKNLLKIIIVGDYDGIAIVTNEFSQSTGLHVPYLDKFAISRKSQGILALADIIWNLLRQSFGDELLWRSRKNNPVNSWYFQRSSGSYNLSNEFRVFWLTNTKGTRLSNQKLTAYIEIGEMIKPSWES
ncbi:hypothetical protein WICPIJ_007461 [Wickerhamomyces pijperi]|uniref:Amino-acid acetyltransferase, mitochondrial n=1 Tax=Wickerhamomyces pijperi TaxID=599730 RepID=A0A9P8PZR9_WICPI|nr:hypothetical protein WICPIJ_007461 [Wickerhamomyces pijperi]